MTPVARRTAPEVHAATRKAPAERHETDVTVRGYGRSLRDPVHGVGPDSRRLPSGALDRNHPGVSVAVSRLLRLRRPASWRRHHAARGQRLQGAGARRRHSRPDRPASPAARVAGRRRTARALSRAQHAAADHGRARHLHPGGDERRPRDSRRSGAVSIACRLSSRSMGCSRSTTSAARPPPTSAFSSTSPGTRSSCTARSPNSRRSRQGYLEEFVRFWSERAEIERIWMSLYTPQVGEVSEERLDGTHAQAGPGGLVEVEHAVLEAAASDGGARGLRQSAELARRVHLRAVDDNGLGEPQDPDHALSVRRRARLFELRLPRVGRPRTPSRVIVCSA